MHLYFKFKINFFYSKPAGYLRKIYKYIYQPIKNTYLDDLNIFIFNKK